MRGEIKLNMDQKASGLKKFNLLLYKAGKLLISLFAILFFEIIILGTGFYFIASANTHAKLLLKDDDSLLLQTGPELTLVKLTNGPGGTPQDNPTIIVGQPVTWSYTITNTGTENLTNLVVVDDNGTSANTADNVTVCSFASLPINESQFCSWQGTAQAGSYTNVATVTANAGGNIITASDSSSYVGQITVNTNTATATATITSTSTATATSTATSTPTRTGTPPTPTLTGTITPNPILTVSVSPLQARVNQSLTFTIRVSNPGTAPAFGAVLTDSFPTFIDVISVTFDEGVVTKSIHSVSVNLGDIQPGTNTTITILTRINSSLTRSQTLSNVVTLTYNSNLVRTSSVVYSAILSSTLPGTGELPILDVDNQGSRTGTGFVFFGMIFGTILSGWSFKNSKGKGIMPILGLGIILTVLIVSACTTSTPVQQQELVTVLPTETATQTLMPYMPAYRFSTPEIHPTLPNYPIPSPSLVPTGDSNGEELDTSPVVRVVIPALEVDALVRYIPFQGNTWPVDGLMEDVAWLGNSSWPGLGGNTVLAGHVTVKGIGNGPFRYLEDLEQGDEVTLYTDLATYTYLVREQVTVEETDLAVTMPTTNSQLTLITCTGWDTDLSIYRFRRVIFADLVKSDRVVVQGNSR